MPRLCLIAAVLLAALQPAAPAFAQQQTSPQVAELERQVQMLRQQWGQATIELDRIRGKNKELQRQLDAAKARLAEFETQQTASAAAPASPVASAAAPPAPPTSADLDAAVELSPTGSTAPPPTTDERVTRLEAEIAQLQRQNETLLAENRSLSAQAGVASADRIAAIQPRVQQTYDRQAGQTIVRTADQRLRVLEGSRGGHTLSVAYSYPGEKLGPGGVPTILGFVDSSHTGSEHRGLDHVTFNIDGRSVEAPVKGYDSTVRLAGAAGKRRIDRGDETVTFEISPDLLRQLARATRAELVLGNVRTDLSRDNLALFKALQARIDQGM